MVIVIVFVWSQMFPLSIFLGSNIGFGVSIESKSFMVFFWGRQSPVTKLYIQFIFRDSFLLNMVNMHCTTHGLSVH